MKDMTAGASSFHDSTRDYSIENYAQSKSEALDAHVSFLNAISYSTNLINMDVSGTQFSETLKDLSATLSIFAKDQDNLATTRMSNIDTAVQQGSANTLNEIEIESKLSNDATQLSSSYNQFISETQGCFN
jgi:hypothetical protein